MQSTFGRRGGALAAILIGLAALLLLAVAISVGAGLYIARNVSVRESRGQTVVETPFGSLRVSEDAHFDPARFGVPVYPGAVRQDDRRRLASFEFDIGDGYKEFTVMAAEYTTWDSVERVAAFYRSELPGWKYSFGKRDRVKLEYADNGHKRIVAIRRQRGRTHIGVASVGEPASN
jgi:hypothetical protein